MGDSLPPAASFDLIGSYARKRGADVEIVLADPKCEIPSSGGRLALTRGKRTVHASAELHDTADGRRLVARTVRAQLGDGIWSLALDSGARERLNARLLVQGRRPLVLLWGDKAGKSVVPPPRRSKRRQAAATAGRTLDRALAPLPPRQAAALRQRARKLARTVLR